MMGLSSLALRTAMRTSYRRSFVAIPLGATTTPRPQTWMQSQQLAQQQQIELSQKMSASDKLHDIIESYRQKT